MPGPVIVNPIPDWLKPENASVTDSNITKALRMIGHFIGADNPTAQVLGLMMSEIPSGPSGGLAGALERLTQKAKTFIKAYHGSPHDFAAERLVKYADGRMEYIVGSPDVLPPVPSGAQVVRDYPLGRQRLDKIGTGEGAQAYGHGLYQAEAEGTAKTYKNVLGGREFQIGDRRLVTSAGGSSRMWDQQTRGETIAADSLDDAFNAQSTSPAQFAANRLREQLKYYPEEAPHINEALNVIANWQKTGAIQKLQGKMYEVAIHADPEHFLDWDKPLSQQSEQVRQALEAQGVRPRTAEEMDLLKYEYAKKFYEKPYFHLNDIEKQEVLRAVEANRIETGAAAYRKVGTPTAAEASARLKQAGIPGIKYLDQGSRAAGEGSRNYVVFDDSLVEILKKYGIAVPVIEGLRAQARRQNGVLHRDQLQGLTQ